MDVVSSMLDLMRRLPPTKIEENVEGLMQISPDYADDLSGNVDQPLKLRVDRATGKEYLACVYNQDGESYRCVTLSLLQACPLRRCVGVMRWGVAREARVMANLGVVAVDYVLLTPVALCRSPWSNEYDPPSEDGPVPPPKLRKLEIAANEAFDLYREM
jgi:capping protein beta